MIGAVFPLVPLRNSAPVLHLTSEETQSERLLLSRYNEWRNHYDECPICNHGDWNSPDFALRPCRVGKVRFTSWQRLSMALGIPK